MGPMIDAFLCSWPFDPWLVAALVLVGVVYLRGWLLLRHRDPGRFSGNQLAAFLGGLVALFLALASPIEPFAALFLQAHMVQHLLLAFVVAPLMLMGMTGDMLRPLIRPRAIVWGTTWPASRNQPRASPKGCRRPHSQAGAQGRD